MKSSTVRVHHHRSRHTHTARNSNNTLHHHLEYQSTLKAKNRVNDEAEKTCKAALTEMRTYLKESAGPFEEAIMETLSKGVGNGGYSCQLSAYHGKSLTAGAFALL